MPMSSKFVRIIPRLDIKGPNLVKGVHLEGLRVLGKPEDFAFQYYLDGADELIYMDIVASLYGRNNLLEIVRRTAERIFIPLTVGGGIRTIEDIRDVLCAGADKVAINTAAIQKPALIKEGARVFGSQCIVVSIEAKRKNNGSYEAFVDNGRQETGIDVFKWVRQAYKLGAGEILVTSIDRDGTGEGYDIELITKIINLVPIPVIACGGAGKIEDVKELIRLTNVDAVSAGSIFHYNKITRDLTKSNLDEGNIEFLKEYSKTGNNNFKRIEPLFIRELKLQIEKTSQVYMRVIKANSYDNPGGRASEKVDFGVVLNDKPLVVMVDYGCGNLFSIIHVLKEIGASFKVSNDPKIIAQADKLLLPGVGSFESGINNLEKMGLTQLIKEHVKAGKPLLGICLGMQLLMSESEEFGFNKGLDLIKGRVTKLQIPQDMETYFKIPHVCWNKIKLPHNRYYKINENDLWKNTILENIRVGSLMYFVHSYVAVPDNPSYILAETEYANNLFCSVIRSDNIYGCQFHPERSGEAGIDIYRQFIFGACKQASEV